MCIECGIKFEQKRSGNSSKFCSRSCVAVRNNKIRKIYGISKETKDKLSLTRKKMFELGLLNVTGGKTKWIDYKSIKVQATWYEFKNLVSERYRNSRKNL